MADPSGPDRDGLEQDLRRVRRLEWLNIAYVCSSITVLVLVMSGSQALKTEFIGDALSLIAPALVLIGGKISAKEPTEDYPFGYERAVTAGYVGAALALLAVGLYLFGDAAAKLIEAEHPIIGGIRLFGGSGGLRFRHCCGAPYPPTFSDARSGGWPNAYTTKYLPPTRKRVRQTG